ncbi:hypothetical protein [Bacteroides salyersiae]|uniref:hypothetical protein n=1 Tax=Bacteroides salyersiae TaxID=291644 RepID=UPI0018A10C21|nr:hypothetical protein [Bacteroides salyersiae]
MEEFANRLRGMNLASISGMIEGLSYVLDGDFSSEKTAEVSEKLRLISEELFNRGLDSQESYLARDNELCDRMLARMDID